MLPISSRAVVSGSSSSSLGARVGRQSPHPRLRRRPRARSPAAVSASGAAACLRWCHGAAATTRAESAQPVFAGVDLVEPHRHAPDGRRDGRARSAFASRELIAPSPSPRASRQAGRRSRPGSAPTTRRAPPRPAGATSKPSLTVPRAGSSRPTAAGPIHSHVPHGLIRCASTARSACASVPTVTASRAIRRPKSTARGRDQSQHVVVGSRCDRDHADVLDHCRQAGASTPRRLRSPPVRRGPDRAPAVRPAASSTRCRLPRCRRAATRTAALRGRRSSRGGEQPHGAVKPRRCSR